MTGGPDVQHELGELSAHVANLDKRLAALLEEERRVHDEIGDSIAAQHAELVTLRDDLGRLANALKVEAATTAVERRVQAAVVGVLGMTAGGALLKLWQYLAQLGRDGQP